MSLTNFFFNRQDENRILANERIRHINKSNDEMRSFADALGSAHGLTGAKVNFPLFHQLFIRKFPNGDPNEFETAYVRGHQAGNERLEYSKKHGSLRGPVLPPSLMEELEGGISI